MIIELLVFLKVAALREGDYARAIALLEEGLVTFRELGDSRRITSGSATPFGTPVRQISATVGRYRRVLARNPKNALSGLKALLCGTRRHLPDEKKNLERFSYKEEAAGSIGHRPLRKSGVSQVKHSVARKAPGHARGLCAATVQQRGS